jgi:hypothetical protein
LHQQREAPRSEVVGRERYPGDVATGPDEDIDEAGLDGTKRVPADVARTSHWKIKEQVI